MPRVSRLHTEPLPERFASMDVLTYAGRTHDSTFQRKRLSNRTLFMRRRQ